MLPKEPEPQPEPQVEAPVATEVQYTQRINEEEEPQQRQSFVSQQPDVIPTQRESIQSDKFETPLAPPEAFSGNENGTTAESVPEIVQSIPSEPVVNEQIYSNINFIQQEQNQAQIEAQIEAQPEAEQINPTALTGNEDYDLSEYIEDTKIQAIALYDYQASADDEISFDPNDLITHIEKVIIIVAVFLDSLKCFRTTFDNFN